MKINTILERLSFINGRLEQTEVKGVSVEYLFVARAALKELYDALLKESSEEKKEDLDGK